MRDAAYGSERQSAKREKTPAKHVSVGVNIQNTHRNSHNSTAKTLLLIVAH